MMGDYGEALPEIPERYSTNICTGRLYPEVQPLTCRESVLYYFVTDSYFMTVRVSGSLKGYKVLSKVCERSTICQ